MRQGVESAAGGIGVPRRASGNRANHRPEGLSKNMVAWQIVLVRGSDGRRARRRVRRKG